MRPRRLSGRVSAGQTIGVVITMAGIVMTGTDARSVAAALSRPKPGVWLALGAMLLFGGWAALMAYATRTQDGLAMILLQRILSVAASLTIVLLLRRKLPTSVGVATAGGVIASGPL